MSTLEVEVSLWWQRFAARHLAEMSQTSAQPVCEAMEEIHLNMREPNMSKQCRYVCMYFLKKGK